MSGAAAPGVAPSPPTRSELRVALATDGPLLRWQARCVEELATVPGVTVERWIRLMEHRPAGGASGDSEAQATVPAPQALQGIEPEDGHAVTGAPESPEAVDVLLDLTERGLPARVPWAVETWRFGYGQALSRDPAYVALRDYVRGPGVTRVALVSEPEGSIVREGWLQTVSWWKGAPLEGMLLDPAGWPAAAAHGRLDPELGVESPAATASVRPTGRTVAPPRPLLTVAAVARRALGAPSSLMGKDSWNVGILPVPIGRMLDPDQRPEAAWFPSRPGRFAADPFGVERDGVAHVFFEDFDEVEGVGSIGYVAIAADGTMSDAESVLDPGVHASYPFLVEHGGEVFMIPETAAAQELVLYRAAGFPRGWRREVALLEGIPALDASLVEHDGRWWMFATRTDRGLNQNLFIWHAPELFGPWTPHAANPVKTDPRSSRPGGTPFVHEGRLYRPSQDDSVVYGGRVVLNRVDVLTAKAFVERPVASIVPRPGSQYPDGLHTLSAVGSRTLVDGNSRRLRLGTLRHNVAGRVPRPRSRR